MVSNDSDIVGIMGVFQGSLGFDCGMIRGSGSLGNVLEPLRGLFKEGTRPIEHSSL